MTARPWDQRIAEFLVQPLVRTPVRPNHLTTLTLLLSLAAAGLFAFAGAPAFDWAAGIFVLARFLDHFDGALARRQGTGSRFGYYYDYTVGAVGYATLFLGLGIGLQATVLGAWAIALGLAGAAAALISFVLNLHIDRELFGAGDEADAVGYPALFGFELEDGIYLLAPVTWLGLLTPFFAAAGIGAAVYCLWTGWRLAVLRRARNS